MISKRSHLDLVQRLVQSLAILLLISASSLAQQKQSVVSSVAPLLKQKIIRQGNQRLGYGGSFKLIGGPQGSIAIEGWQRNEVDVTAEIELQAESEEDLGRLATVNGFIVDEDVNSVRLLTTGTHDKAFMKRVAKDFPKKLLGLPWKIDFRIRVPFATDLEIDGGRGPIAVSGVEGAIRLAAVESNTRLVLTGGAVAVTIAVGKVEVNIPVRSWRGGGADIRVAAGTIAVEFPAGFNGDIDAEILRNGTIEDSFGAFEVRERPGITPRQVKARAGAGGAFFRFTVGDGMVYLKKVMSDK